MPLYDVTRQNGTVIRIEALNPSLASQMVRYPGELIKSVSLVRTTTGIPTVPSVPGITPTAATRPPPTPTVPTAAAPTPPPEPTATVKPAINIPATAGELKTIADAKAKGLCVGTMKTYYTVKTYKVALARGGSIYVEALDENTAKQKAIDAGYTVAWVGRYYEWKQPPTSQPPGEETAEPVPQTDSMEVVDGAGHTYVVNRPQWDVLPDNYKTIFKDKGYKPMLRAIYIDNERQTREWGRANTQLADGRWMSNTDFRDLQTYDSQNGTNYANIAQNQGWTALQVAIAYTGANQQAAIDKMTKYKTGDGYNLLAARADGVLPGTMKLAGFDNKDIKWADDAYNTSIQTGVALPGAVTWVNPSTGKRYTDAEYKQLLADYDAKWRAAIGKPEFYELPPNPRNEIRLSDESSRRLLVEGASMFFFQPARALLPEVGIKDIGKLEWAVGGAQLATFLMPFVPAKAMPGVAGAAAGIFGYATAKSWPALSPAEKALGIGGTALVGLPALLALGSKFRPAISGIKVAKGEVVAATPQGRLQLLNRIVRWQGDIKVQGVEGPAATKVNKAYLDMGHEFGRYTNTELALKEVQNAISEMGLAKNKAELNYLNRLRAVETKLSRALAESGDSLVRKTQTFTDLYLDNAKGIGDLAPWELQEIADRPKTIRMDSDALTTQLFGSRNALEITSDIRDITKQIDVIEDAVKKGVAPGQAREYGKVVDTLNTQIDNLNRELRARYVATGEEVAVKGETLRMKVITQQQRLVRAVEDLEHFKGTAQGYPTYRKGELATEAGVIRAERDIMEGIQKTTEAMWGKESYTSVLEGLNRQLDDIMATMRKAGIDTRKATNATFDIYGAIKNEDPRALKAAVEQLKLEAGKIPDKALQLRALEQAKWLEGPTVDKFWKAWEKARTTAVEGKEPVYEHTVEEYAAKVRRAEAEKIVQRRYEELEKTVPSYMKKGSGISKPSTTEEITDWLRKEYPADYWKDKYGGKYQDLDDFLDVGRVEHDLMVGVKGEPVPLEKEWQAKVKDYVERETDIQTHEAERDLTTTLYTKEELRRFIKSIADTYELPMPKDVRIEEMTIEIEGTGKKFGPFAGRQEHGTIAIARHILEQGIPEEQVPVVIHELIHGQAGQSGTGGWSLGRKLGIKEQQLWRIVEKRFGETVSKAEWKQKFTDIYRILEEYFAIRKTENLCGIQNTNYLQALDKKLGSILGDSAARNLRAKIFALADNTKIGRQVGIREATKIYKGAEKTSRLEALNEHLQQLNREIQQKKTALKEATKTEPAIQKVITEAEREKMKVIKVEKSEKPLITAEESAKEKAARIKAEERAAQLIKAATKETPAKPEPYKGGFPGIKPRVGLGSPFVITDYRTQVRYVVNRDGSITRLDPITRIATTTRLSPQIQVNPAIREAVKQAVRTAVQTSTQTKTQTKTKTQTQLKQAVQTAVQTRLATETIPAPKLKTITVNITDLVVDTITVPPPVVPPPSTWRIERQRLPSQPKQTIKREGPALAVWKQGSYWVSIFPPFRTTGRQEDVVYSLKRPPWGSVIAKGRHAPKKTLKSMGKIPQVIIVPMGVVTARITNGRHLTFSRRTWHRGRVIEG